MTAAILAIAGILAVVVLLAIGLARDSRRREDAWAGWEALFPDEDGLPPRDERLEGLLRRDER